MDTFFKRTKQLEDRVDDFLDAISEGAIVFQAGVKDYIHGQKTQFEERINQIKLLESKADNLRRFIENELYTHSLIPEHRGDVLGLLESMDEVIDTAKKTLIQFSIEHPEIYEEFHADFLELTEMAVMAVESIVKSTRAFFKDIKAVKNDLHKVSHFEKEADRVEERLKRKIFQQDNMRLSHQMHLRYFAQHVSELADAAENVADRLMIYTIKRQF